MIRRPPRSTLFPYTTLSDLLFEELEPELAEVDVEGSRRWLLKADLGGGVEPAPDAVRLLPHLDRKSTRLNSSHLVISYAVFCLKKKNTKQIDMLCTYTINAP